MNFAGQPSMHTLERWLMHKPAKFERYLEAHPEVADRFEQLNPLAGIAASVRGALDDALVVPADLAERLRSTLFDGSRETSTFAILLDLGGVGPATLQLLAGPLIDED